MQEELITFKTAKLAKEKGFVNGTKGCFIVYKEDDINPKGDKGTKKGEFEYCKRFSLKNGELDSDEDYNYLERPTQSLLQKWLREIHEIIVEIKVGFDIEDGEIVYYYTPFIKRKESIDFVKHSGLLTSMFESKDNYEDALEMGLQEALKRI